MVTGRGGHDFRGVATGGESGDPVEGAPDLERTRALEMLGLHVNGPADQVESGPENMAGVGRSTGWSRAAACSMSSGPTIGIKLGSLVEQYGQVRSKMAWSSTPWPGPFPGRQIDKPLCQEGRAGGSPGTHGRVARKVPTRGDG